jgi:hypothetical protein
MREELQAEVDQLPQPRPQEGRILAGGGGPHHPPPFDARQQVRSSRLNIISTHAFADYLC